MRENLEEPRRDRGIGREGRTGSAVAEPVRPDLGAVHALRTVGMSSASVGIAAAAHAWAEGCVSLGGAALVLALTLPSAAGLTRRELSFRSVLGWLSATQAGIHLILTGLCGGSVLTESHAMLAAHACAVLVTALLLQVGDGALWAASRLGRACRFVLVLLRWAAIPPERRLRFTAVAPVRVAPSLWRCPSLVLRGPPGACAS